MPPKRPDDPLEGPKRALRQAMRARMAAVDRHDLARYSTLVCENALMHERVGAARTILVYLPLPDEVDVRPLARVLLDRGVTICAPRVDWDARDMAPAQIASLDEGFEVRRHAVPEPVAGGLIDAGALDVVIVPGLAFDLAGGRLGRGAGFYDRFLTRLTPGRALLMGACLEAQIVPGVPAGPRDVRVDCLATETRVHRTTNLKSGGRVGPT